MRPSWDEYFLLQAKIISLRSTCNSRPQGAVLVKERRILTSGYNGALSGQEHCLGKIMYLAPGNLPIPYCHRRATATPDFQKDRVCRSAHAEANAIAIASRFGISIVSCICYCTTKPCPICQKLLFQAGVVEIIYELDYDEPEGYINILPCRELRLSQDTIDQAVRTIRNITSERRLERTK